MKTPKTGRRARKKLADASTTPSTPTQDQAPQPEMQTMYQALVEQVGDIVYQANTDGRLTYVSPQVSRYGWKPQDLLATPLLETDFILAEDRERVARDLQTTMVTGEEFPSEFRMRDSQGNIHWFEDYGKALRNEEGEIIGLLGVLREITERKTLESDLRESEDRFRLLSDATQEGVLIHEKGVILAANKALAEMFGYEPGEVIGMQAYDLTAPESHELIKQILEQGLQSAYEGVFIRKDGSRFPGMAYLCQSKRAEIVVIRDIAEDKRIRETLRAQASALEQKNATLKEVLAQIETEALEVKKQVSHNVDKFLWPLIKKLRCSASSIDKTQFDLLERGLRDLTSRFGMKIAKDLGSLSPTEIEICSMIRAGMSSKEIAEARHVSLRTVQTQRNKIRKKLGLIDKKTNLTTFLQDLD